MLASNIAELARRARIALLADPSTLVSVQRDFGGLAAGSALGLAEPSSSAEVQRLFGAAAELGLRCTIRGRGYSQSGQAVGRGSLCVATRRLDRIEPSNAARLSLRVGAGATPRQVLMHTLPLGLSPVVIPLNLDMSLGGLLSAGGIGANSFRDGLFASNVNAAKVVTTGGDLRDCSRDGEPELFEAVVAGLGRAGMIVELELKLRRVQARVSTTSLLYYGLEEWWADYLSLAQNEAVSYLEGVCWAAPRGVRFDDAGQRPFAHWLYGLEVGVEHAAGEGESSLARALGGVDRGRTVAAGELAVEYFAERYEPRFSAMLASGAWNDAHPWFEAFLPLPSLPGLLPQLLERLPLDMGDGHRVLLVANRAVPGLVPLPAGELCAMFGALPMGIPAARADAVRRSLEATSDLVLEHGSSRYLSGWLGPGGPSTLDKMMGARSQRFHVLRARFDPDQRLSSVLLDG